MILMNDHEDNTITTKTVIIMTTTKIITIKTTTILMTMKTT